MNTRELFNSDWQFARLGLNIEYTQKEEWQKLLQPVAIPHDFQISDTLNLYGDATGFYRKEFLYHRQQGEVVQLIFDGVYMDYSLYVNDQEIGQWKYGYSPATFDITNALVEGKNDLVVRVVYQSPNSRWYSGAGIYRNVWLQRLPEKHILTDGIYTMTKYHGEDYDLYVDVELTPTALAEGYSITYTLTDEEGIVVKKEADLAQATVLENTEIDRNAVSDMQAFWVEKELQTPDGRALETGVTLRKIISVWDPRPWDVDDPYLYHFAVELKKDGETIQLEESKVGFSTKEFSPKHGFILNGRKVKINGVCEHHDLGALGAAFSKEAMARKFRILKQMGVNGLRTSHNMPAREVLELADEMGILVVAESYDMWEFPKTTYDYARFFKDWADIDLRSFIRRDRSHASLLMWSVGNEIYDTHAGVHGQEITQRLMDTVSRYDYMNNAPATIGSNYMAWEGAQNCADMNKMAGYNYGETLYDRHHEEHPDWVIYGSETASVIKSRGIYHFPLQQTILTDDDEQCSALGNSCTSWGAKNEEYCITMDRDRAYSCGQFIWTGFDYIGEPTPYQTKNSYFGQVDTAGIPKDAYYIYKGEWTDYKKAPFVHIFPYWDFNDGQMVDVRVCSNAPRVQLFVNGVLLEDKRIDHENGTDLLAHAQLPYHAGSIVGVALDEEGRELAREERYTPSDPVQIVLTADKEVLKADGEDLTFVEIKVVDEQGKDVDNASHYVEVEVSGAGRLVGLDNGDSTDYDSYQGTIRKLFSGRLMAIIASTDQSGEIQVCVRDARESKHAGTASRIGTTSPKALFVTQALKAEECTERECGNIAIQTGILHQAKLILQSETASVREGICLRKENTFTPLIHVPVGFVPTRKIALTCEGGYHLNENRQQMLVKAMLYPQDATDQEIIFKAVTASGIESNLATVEVKGREALVTARGDGEFYIRAMVKNGTDKVKLISQMECSVEGMGTATLDPYSFVTGGLFTRAQGAVLCGLENGASTARGESAAGFDGIDFGDYGSDEITVSIFANSNDPQFIQFYEGMPGEEGSILLYEGVYHKQSRWQVFQPEIYRLNKRLRGITTLSVKTKDSLEFGGFTFKRLNPAFEENMVAENKNIYGDAFTVLKDSVEHIGNNVSIQYSDMDFGEKGIHKITICGRTPLEKNTIHVRFDNGTEKKNEIVEFPKTSEYTEHTFELSSVAGVQQVSFIFLPGCDFDFKWFRFS